MNCPNLSRLLRSNRSKAAERRSSTSESPSSRSEGLPAQVSPQEYFNLDKAGFFAYDGTLGLQRETVESDSYAIVTRNADGAYYRSLVNQYSTPTFVKATVNTQDDWLSNRCRLAAGEHRLPQRMRHDPVTGLATSVDSMTDYFALCRSEGRFTVLSPIDPIWYALRLLGEENALCAIAEDPEFIQMIVEDYAVFNENMLRVIIGKGYHFDTVWVFSDLCYKNGMLFSPEFFRNRIMKSFQKYVALCHEAGSKFIFHCDGNIGQLLPLLIEAGVDCIQPLEARTGNDIRNLIPKYGKQISFIGNINADILATTHKKIEEELLNKMPPAVSSHRYIFHSDHSIPPDISLDNYTFAVDLARKLGRYA